MILLVFLFFLSICNRGESIFLFLATLENVVSIALPTELKACVRHILTSIVIPGSSGNILLGDRQRATKLFQHVYAILCLSSKLIEHFFARHFVTGIFLFHVFYYLSF